MTKIKICFLPQNVSWNGTFDSVTSRLLLGHILLEHIGFFHPVAYPLNNNPKVKSVSIKNQRTWLFMEKKTQTVISHEVSLCNNDCGPGFVVSIDHLESLMKGSIYNFFGHNASEKALG